MHACLSVSGTLLVWTVSSAPRQNVSLTLKGLASSVWRLLCRCIGRPLSTGFARLR